MTPPPTSAPALALDAASLRALLEKHKGADHFQVLGVKRDGPAAAIKVAYFQLARSYHPDAVPADATPEVKKLCGDVFARVGEAWAVLGDDARRAAYLEELKSGGAADVDVMRILHAETVFQEATVLVKSRRYEDGLAKLDEAVKLNPDEAEFGVWKAWCEFLLAADKKRQQPASAAAIEAAIKKNAKCAPAYQFLGQMAKLVGDLNLAEKHLKRGLQALPETPRPGPRAQVPQALKGRRAPACGQMRACRPARRSGPSCPPRPSAARCVPPATTSRRWSRWGRRG